MFLKYFDFCKSTQKLYLASQPLVVIEITLASLYLSTKRIRNRTEIIKIRKLPCNLLGNSLSLEKRSSQINVCV